MIHVEIVVSAALKVIANYFDMLCPLVALEAQKAYNEKDQKELKFKS